MSEKYIPYASHPFRLTKEQALGLTEHSSSGDFSIGDEEPIKTETRYSSKLKVGDKVELINYEKSFPDFTQKNLPNELTVVAVGEDRLGKVEYTLAFVSDPKETITVKRVFIIKKKV